MAKVLARWPTKTEATAVQLSVEPGDVVFWFWFLSQIQEVLVIAYPAELPEPLVIGFRQVLADAVQAYDVGVDVRQDMLSCTYHPDRFATSTERLDNPLDVFLQD
jgi:hypothetical protein